MSREKRDIPNFFRLNGIYLSVFHFERIIAPRTRFGHIQIDFCFQIVLYLQRRADSDAFLTMFDLDLDNDVIKSTVLFENNQSNIMIGRLMP